MPTMQSILLARPLYFQHTKKHSHKTRFYVKIKNLVYMAHFLLIVQRVKNGLLRFLQLQLYLNLCSLPILIAWGLPISLLTPLGNYIFNPFLVIFLLCSSVIFFFELLVIPNGWLIWCLEKIGALWIGVMPAASSWLTGCIQLPWIILLVIPVLATCILFHKRTRSYGRSIGCFLAMLCAIYGYSFYTTRTTTLVMHADCGKKGAVTVIHDRGQLVVIDPGVIGGRSSAGSWLSYTLAPQVIKATGNARIDYLILLQPSSVLFDALAQLYAFMDVRHIYFVPWTDPIITKRAFAKLFANIDKSRVVCLREKTYRIPLSNGRFLLIEPLGDVGENKEGQFPLFGVRGFVDKQEVAIYPVKMKKRSKVLPGQAC